MKYNAAEAEEVNQHLQLPSNIWSREILSRVSHREMSFFARSCKEANQISIEHIHETFKCAKFNAVELFQKAHSKGVKLNIPLLYRLCNTYRSAFLFYKLQLEEDASWGIAAICGDIEWLKKFRKDFIEIKTQSKQSQVGIIYFVAMGGHLEIIKEHFGPTLKRYSHYRETLWIREINYIAGRVGHFHICDHLEDQYGVKPNIRLEHFESTIHFYAHYGETERLRTALEKYPDFGQNENLFLYAARSGNIKTIDLLDRAYPDKLKVPDPTSGETVVHVAAEFGHRDLLIKLLLTDKEKGYHCDPCQKTSDGITPLHLSTTTGLWDCFWVLLPFYKMQTDYQDILNAVPQTAVGQNHIDFFRQFVARFGTTCVHAKNSYGSPLSHELVSSKNIRIAKILVYEYGMNLMSTNAEGETATIFMARVAYTKNIVTLWQFIAEVIREFNPQFNHQLHLKPDQGKSLQDYITLSGQQALFSDILEPDTLLGCK